MASNTVASPDPNDPFANPTPAQRIPDQPSVSDEDMIHAFYDEYFKRMSQQAPVAPPPPKLKWYQNMNLNTVTPGPLQQMMLQRYMAQDPATRDYMQKKAAYDESQAQAKEMGPVLGAGLHAQATLGAQQIRSQAMQDEHGRKWVQDQTGQWVMLQPINQSSQVPSGSMSSTTPPIAMQGLGGGTPNNVSTDPGVSVRPSGVKGLIRQGGPTNPKIIQSGKGPMQWNIMRQAWEPAVDSSGNQLQPPTPANMAGMQVQLDNAMLALKNMKASYEKGQSQSLGTKTVGAMASDITNRFPSLRGAAEQYTTSGSDAIQHEQNRHTVAALSVRPLANTSRAQGLMEQFLQVIPHFTDTPEVANNFYNQYEQFLTNARRLPWDQDPQGAEQQYENMANQFTAQAQSAKMQPHTGRTVPRSRIKALPPEDQAATESGLRSKGVQIDEAN